MAERKSGSGIAQAAKRRATGEQAPDRSLSGRRNKSGAADPGRVARDVGRAMASAVSAPVKALQDAGVVKPGPMPSIVGSAAKDIGTSVVRAAKSAGSSVAEVAKSVAPAVSTTARSAVSGIQQAAKSLSKVETGEPRHPDIVKDVGAPIVDAMRSARSSIQQAAKSLSKVKTGEPRHPDIYRDAVAPIVGVAKAFGTWLTTTQGTSSATKPAAVSAGKSPSATASVAEPRSAVVASVPPGAPMRPVKVDVPMVTARTATEPMAASSKTSAVPMPVARPSKAQVREVVPTPVARPSNAQAKISARVPPPGLSTADLNRREMNIRKALKEAALVEAKAQAERTRPRPTVIPPKPEKVWERDTWGRFAWRDP